MVKLKELYGCLSNSNLAYRKQMKRVKQKMQYPYHSVTVALIHGESVVEYVCDQTNNMANKLPLSKCQQSVFLEQLKKPDKHKLPPRCYFLGSIDSSSEGFPCCSSSPLRLSRPLTLSSPPILAPIFPFAACELFRESHGLCVRFYHSSLSTSRPGYSLSHYCLIKLILCYT